jgi:ABC-type sugar transport system ATPase subunit
MSLNTKAGPSNDRPILEVRGISKSIPGVRALKNVDLRIWPGEVHALMGENGAGKSTLMKILAGAYRPDAGEILIDGKPVQFRTPHEARSAGIGIIYQE